MIYAGNGSMLEFLGHFACRTYYVMTLHTSCISQKENCKIWNGVDWILVDVKEDARQLHSLVSHAVSKKAKIDVRFVVVVFTVHFFMSLDLWTLLVDAACNKYIVTTFDYGVENLWT